jgi:hypothetical protein
MTTLLVCAIDPVRLDAVRAAGRDESGNPLVASVAEGWEPLRCCLNKATLGEPIALISFSPFTVHSPWAETGPVFIHARGCSGYGAPGVLPADLRTGPRVLRTYHADGSLDYDDITVVGPGEDIEVPLRELLGRSQVAVVHVRALAAQCYTYAVTRRS